MGPETTRSSVVLSPGTLFAGGYLMSQMNRFIPIFEATESWSPFSSELLLAVTPLEYVTTTFPDWSRKVNDNSSCISLGKK